MAGPLFNFEEIHSLHFFTHVKFPTCTSQGALSPGIVNEVLEFLLDLNVQDAAPVPLDKAHPQMHHKLSLLCWDQMPVKTFVFSKFKIINVTFNFKLW
jgi:hypothetical protein